MIITIGENTKKMMEVLEIKEFPFSATLLKKNFKLLLDKYHPDKNNGKGDNNKTRQIIEAHNALRNLTFENITIDEPKRKLKSDDLFSLWEKCTECKGSGKVETQEFVGYSPCDCDWSRSSNWPSRREYCRACRGTGKFKLRSGRIVTCIACHGYGTRTIRICPVCNGSKEKAIYRDVMVDCPKCHGLGECELKPFNPVIPKGAVLI